MPYCAEVLSPQLVIHILMAHNPLATAVGIEGGLLVFNYI